MGNWIRFDSENEGLTSMCSYKIRSEKPGLSLVVCRGERPSNGLACVNGAVQGAEGKQEGFLHLLWECFNGAVEFVQKWDLVIEFEIFKGASGNLLNRHLPGEFRTITHYLKSDRMGNVRESQDYASYTGVEAVYITCLCCNESGQREELVEMHIRIRGRRRHRLPSRPLLLRVMDMVERVTSQ